MIFHNTLIITALSTLLYACTYTPVETESSYQKKSTDKILRHGFKAFSVHDTDNNGYLDKQEYELLLEHRERKRELKERPGSHSIALSFEEIDLNADNEISEDEMINALNQRLKQHRRYRHKYFLEKP